MKSLILSTLFFSSINAVAQAQPTSPFVRNSEDKAILDQQASRASNPGFRGNAIKTRLMALSYSQYGSNPDFDSITYFYSLGRGGTDSLIGRGYEWYPYRYLASRGANYDGIYADSSYRWKRNGAGNAEKKSSERYSNNFASNVFTIYREYPAGSTEPCTRLVSSLNVLGYQTKYEQSSSPLGTCGAYSPFNVRSTSYNGNGYIEKDSSWSVFNGQPSISTSEYSFNSPTETNECIRYSWYNGVRTFYNKDKYENYPLGNKIYALYLTPPSYNTWDTSGIDQRSFDAQNRFTDHKVYTKDQTTKRTMLTGHFSVYYTGNNSLAGVYIDSGYYGYPNYHLDRKQVNRIDASGRYDSISYAYSQNGTTATPFNYMRMYYSADGLLDSVSNFAFDDVTGAFATIPEYTTRYYYELYNTAAGIPSTPRGGQKIILHPNPVLNTLSITAGSSVSVIITDVTGRMNYQGDHVTEVNMAGYPSGVYFLQAIDKDGHRSVQSFVKE